ncbi:MAG: DEAD/DEAH box helicase, partial [Candidatus Aenigmarchaeota archaeon]|nr:DEAD/DEAH box helicase [Candidatus Aenigmarchaeota archaeon]
MIWEIFSKKMQEKIAKRGFGSPTSVQQEGMPQILAGSNVLLMAPTGMGKCVGGDTVVLTESGPARIKDLYGRRVRVATLQNDLKISINTAIVIRKKKSVQYDLSTATGRSIKATPDHKLLTLSENGIEWRPLENLRVGDYIAVPRSIPIAESDAALSLASLTGYGRTMVSVKPSVSDILKDLVSSGTGIDRISEMTGFSRSKLSRAYEGKPTESKLVLKLCSLASIDPRSISVRRIGVKHGKGFNFKIDEDFAYFVGLVIGDGNTNSRRNLRFSSTSHEIIAWLRAYCKEMGLELKKDKSHDCDYYATSQALVNLLYSVGIPEHGKSANVSIPGFFFRNRSLLASALRGIYDTDGSVYGNVIELTTKSKRLADDVMLALSCFGIVCLIKDKTVKDWNYKRVMIEDSASARIFMENIGFLHAGKKLRLDGLCSRKSNTNIDIIPNTRRTIELCRKKMSVPYSRQREFRVYESYREGRRNPSRRGLLSILEYFSKFSASRPEEYETLRCLAESDIFWDKIKCVGEIPEDWVYDATVPGAQNFIGNCIVLHNTESTLLPIFDSWMKNEHKPVSMLYITPMKSLNRDLQKRIIWWAKELDMDASVRHGDTTQYERGMQAENPPDLLISTPEALQSMLVGKKIRRHLSNIRWIVIDEVHEIVASKRGVQLSIALERLKELIRAAGNPEPQMVGLSATIGSPAEVAAYITGNKDCRIVDTMHIRGLRIAVEAPKPSDDDYKTAPQVFMTPQTAARVRRIDQLMRGKESVLAFTNTRESAEVISSRLKAFDSQLKVETHHSSLSRDIRVKAEEGFKSGDIRSLVSTSSLELGIDIGSIDFIIQFMSPRQVCKLLQRIGRSGHTSTGMSEGVIISSDPDDCFESAAIAKLALGGKIEPSRLYGQSLDVLMHQIVGIALEEYDTPLEKAYNIIRRAWPFRSLSMDDFNAACLLLQKLGLIWVDEKPEGEAGTQKDVHASGDAPATKSGIERSEKKDGSSGLLRLRRRRRAWEYYFQNMSTIPDSRSYKVLDVLSNQFIGTLDAEFVALHGAPGTGFIVKGQAWRILEILKDRIMVEPMKGVEAAIPAWVGELIPVPRDVAQLVGRMRREIVQMLKGGMKDSDARKFLKEHYPVNDDVAALMVSTMKKQEYGSVPDENSIIIEHAPVDGINTIVVNSCFGSLINETLGRAVSDMLAIRFGSVGLQTDPCRIVLKMHSGGVQDVMDTISRLNPEHIKSILDTSMPNTELFQWRFMHVAQRAGVISRDADFGKFYLRKIIEAYKGTPVFRETLHELYEEKLDLKGAEELLKSVREGGIKVSVKAGLSYVSRLGILPRHEVMASEKPDTEIFRIFKERLSKTRVRLVCTQCSSAVTYIVEDLPREIRCVGCKAKLVGVISPDDMDSEIMVSKGIKGKPLTKEEEEQMEKISDSAALVAASGRD